MTISGNDQKQDLNQNKLKTFKGFISKNKIIICTLAIVAVLIIIGFCVTSTINDNNNKNSIINYYNEIPNNDLLSESEITSTLSSNYSDKYVKYLFDYEKIDFNKNALNFAYYYMNNLGDLSDKNALKNELTRHEFTDSQIDYALNNIDWDKLLSNYIEACFIDKNMSKSEIYDNLLEMGYDENDINEAYNILDFDGLVATLVNQIISKDKDIVPTDIYITMGATELDSSLTENALNSIDFHDLALKKAKEYIEKERKSVSEGNCLSKAVIKMHLNSDRFSDSLVERVIGEIDWDGYINDYIQGEIRRLGTINRAYTKKCLTDFGYDSSEIDRVLNKVDWKSQAISYLEQGYTSKKDCISNLTNNGFTSEEANYAYSNVDWKKICLLYLKKKCEGYEKYHKYVLFGCLDGNFSEDEISHVINTIGRDWKEDAYLYMKENSYYASYSKEQQIQSLLELHYTSEEAEYAINKYSSNS